MLEYTMSHHILSQTITYSNLPSFLYTFSLTKPLLCAALDIADGLPIQTVQLFEQFSESWSSAVSSHVRLRTVHLYRSEGTIHAAHNNTRGVDCLRPLDPLTHFVMIASLS